MLQLCPQGPLHVERLIEVYGRKCNMSKWLSDLKGDQSATHTACTNAIVKIASQLETHF
jgi:hypothetical protein